jgi:uncharacterized protein
MIDPDLIHLLRCPESHQTLSTADAELVDQINRAVAAGRLTNRARQSVTEPIEAGLVRADRQYLYPVRNNIPVLLVDEAIPLPPT